MKVQEIVVSAGRTFNHPYESYSNLRPHVQLRATLEDGEDFKEAVQTLQNAAEGLVEDHKQNMLASIERLENMSRQQQEMQGLEATLKKAQERINEIRGKYPQLALEIEEK